MYSAVRVVNAFQGLDDVNFPSFSDGHLVLWDLGTGKFVASSPMSILSGEVLITLSAATKRGLFVQLVSGHTADAFQVKNSGGTSVTRITSIGSGIFGGSLSAKVVTLTDAATIATDASLGNEFRISSATDRTLGVPTNPTDGQCCRWRWANTDSSSRQLTLSTSAGGFQFTEDIPALTATSPGKADFIGAIYVAAKGYWDVVSYTKGATA
jgi:hypothetical protein